jgi:hypothetical protein
MRVQWRKLDPNDLEAIPEGEQILFVNYHQNRFVEEFAGTIQDAKIHREYQLKNSYTHWLLLPKIKGKP